MHSSQLGNDDYPKTSSATYELMRRRSGSYDVGRRGNRGGNNNGTYHGTCGGGGHYGRAFQFIQQ